LNIDRNEGLKRQLQGKTDAEMEFFVIHGFLPHQEEKPTLVASAEPPQLPESTGVSEPPKPDAASETTESKAS
jgi:hypothetical protein